VRYSDSVRGIACIVVWSGLALAAETPAELFDRAVRAINAADYPAAETALNQVLLAAPNHLGALHNLGLVYSRTGRLDGAIATYRRALELNPKDRSLLMNLGVALMKRESYAEAAGVFSQLFEAHPDAPAARDAGLLTLLVAGARSDAVLRRVPLHIAGLVRCRVAVDAERFDDAAALCRAAGARLEVGRALVGLHDPEAIVELTGAVHAAPDDPQAHYYLGVALMQADRVEEAAQSLERSRALDANFWGTWFYLGKARLKQDAGAAIPLLQRAAELNPNAATVFYELGLALKAGGREEDARRAMDRVREIRARELRADEEALRKR
jgi:tetratricopeptide (TPR) repeat protein